MKFPYLHDVEIEREAAMLLHSFEQRYGEVKNAVPIEELMENHLKLALEIIDEDTDILGCININQRKVYINEAIYPEDIKKKAGRYNFTLGHEVAHWIRAGDGTLIMRGKRISMHLMVQPGVANKLLGMAKEGFDWAFCEHALTVGYRGSLTEIIQIIGRCTRDSSNKTHAQFTNLIAQPDATDDLVKLSVNNKRYAPREWFVAPIDVIERAVTLLINGEIVNYNYDVERQEIVAR